MPETMEAKGHSMTHYPGVPVVRCSCGATVFAFTTKQARVRMRAHLVARMETS